MRRIAIVVVAVVLVVVLAVAGIGYMAIRDENSAMDELGALQSQISDIQKEAQDNPSLAETQANVYPTQ